MNKQNTRRGYTQEDINENKGHSRRLLSGISTTVNSQKGRDPQLQSSGMIHKNKGHDEKSLRSICSALTTQGRDPEQKHFRMTLWNNGAFTLIELLVVVLIIAVLAAVALPQYNKAVAKSRGTEALEAVNTLDKALAAYYLEHGSYEGASAETLNVQLPELKHFRYVVGTNIFENGSYSLPTLETYNANNQTGIFIVESSNMGIHAVWEKGKLKEKGCTRLTNSYECDYYFHCNWKIQVGTDGSITSKWCVFD